MKATRSNQMNQESESASKPLTVEQVEKWRAHPNHSLNTIQPDDFGALCDLALSALASPDLDGERRDAERYAFWRDHPRSHFVVHVANDGKITLKLDAFDVETWDTIYSKANVDSAIDAAMKAGEGKP